MGPREAVVWRYPHLRVHFERWSAERTLEQTGQKQQSGLSAQKPAGETVTEREELASENVAVLAVRNSRQLPGTVLRGAVGLSMHRLGPRVMRPYCACKAEQAPSNS